MDINKEQHLHKYLIIIWNFGDVGERLTNFLPFTYTFQLFTNVPHVPNRWLQGDRKTARCISCNGRFKPGLEEGGIYSVVEKKEQEKAAKS